MMKIDVSNFDARGYLASRGIRYTEDGSNVSQNWIAIRCLWCSDKSNHLGISEDGTINCWRCPVSGTVLKLIMKIDRCNLETAQNTVESFKKRLSISKHREIFADVRSSHMARPDFVYQRSDALSHYDFSSEMHVLQRAFLEKRNYDADKITQTYGLLFAGPLGRYAMRIIFPIRVDEIAVNFVARDITDLHPKKWDNCSNEHALVNMKHTLYGLDDSQGSSVFVVEGAFDKTRIGKDCVAVMGVNYTPAQVRLLCRYQRVFVLFDAEEKAQEQAEHLCKDLSVFVPEVRRVELTSGDPDNLSEYDVKMLRNQYLQKFY